MAFIKEQPEIDGIRVNQIWILKDSGMCLFHASFGSRDEEVAMDMDIFTGLLGAISSLATQAVNSPVKKIAMGQMILHQYKKGDLLCCLSTKKDVKDEKVLSEFLQNLMHEFENDYNPILGTNAMFELASFEKFQSRLIDIFNIQFLSEKAPCFDLVYKLLGDRSLEKIVTALIVGEKIAVVGDKAETEIIISTLEQFCPHRELKKVYWTTVPIEDADLVGVPRSMEKYQESQGYKIVDIKNPRKFVRTSNDFAKKIIRDIKNLDDPKTATFLIKTRMDYFISRVSTILDLYSREKVDKKLKRLIQRDINKNLFNLIEEYIKRSVNPDFALPNRLDLWNKLSRF